METASGQSRVEIIVRGPMPRSGAHVVLAPFDHFFSSGSVPLARVTPLFLAVTGFLSFRAV